MGIYQTDENERSIISNKKERLWKESIKRKGVRKGINKEKEGIQMIMTIHSGFVIILRKIVSLLNRFRTNE